MTSRVLAPLATISAQSFGTSTGIFLLGLNYALACDVAKNHGSGHRPIVQPVGFHAIVEVVSVDQRGVERTELANGLDDFRILAVAKEQMNVVSIARRTRAA